MMKKIETSLKVRELWDKLENPVKAIWALFCVFSVIRFMEYFSLSAQYANVEFLNYAAGLLFDFIFASMTGIIFILLFVILPRKFFRAAMISTTIIIFLMAVITWALTEYYQVTLIPLDHSLLVYPLSEVLYISSSSAGFTLGQILKLIVIIVVSIALPVFVMKQVKFSQPVRLLAFLPVLGALVFFHNIRPEIKNYNKNHDFYQQVNKTSHLLHELVKYKSSSRHYAKHEIAEIARQYQQGVNEFDYISYHYPFMRNNTDKDQIGRFFEFRDENPNFVLIIVESLSRDFSGPNARWGSFTPFLDSLASKSLYWSNFLVTSERTFNILPSALASLPYADKGFMAMVDDKGSFPDFLSLNAVLSKNANYNSSFFYGGWAGFDFMKSFLKEAGVDFFLEKKGFGREYRKIGEADEEFSWGYHDHDVYRRSMEILDSLNYQPRIDIYLTLSMHDPFAPPSPKKWENAFRAHLKQMPATPKPEDFYLKRQKQLSTIFYADDALRQFFHNYKKRPDFENTIFFVFGDHHLPMHDYSPIEKYHVPLLVFSPLLKESKIIPAVSSSADITPTIASMMKDNFDVEIPGQVHWLGAPLDTCSAFKANTFVPFMRVNRDINELLMQKYFLSEGRLFNVDEQMNLSPSSDTEKRREMEEMLDAFNILNEYVCNLNVIYKPIKPE
ncbi:MAG: LTA synthase family protein [Bacteroidales bacterium]